MQELPPFRIRNPMLQTSALTNTLDLMTPGLLLSPATGTKAKRAIAKFVGCAVLLVMTACSTQGPLKPGAGAASEGVSKETAADSPAAKRVPKFGLALGGGAARGFAHVGVIQVLEEAGIKPDFVVGTSAGSLVAAFYASGKTARNCNSCPKPWTKPPSQIGRSLY